MTSESLLYDFDQHMDDPNKVDNPSQLGKSSKSQLPSLNQIESSSANVKDVVKALKITGGVIVRDFLGMEEIGRILKDVSPYLEADQPWDGNPSSSPTLRYSLISNAAFVGNFFPPETRRAYGLMGKSPTFATSIVGNSLWMGVTDALLTSCNKYNWVCPINSLLRCC
jgi:hypothetical protein